jgi:hypothetical protein
VTTLALGGVLDDWSFVISIVAAAATVSAVVVALKLAHDASQRERANERRGREMKARQIAQVIEAREHATGGVMRSHPKITVVNGTDEVISNVSIDVTPQSQRGRGHSSTPVTWTSARVGRREIAT